MLSNFERERLRVLDRLLTLDHETINDLLEQAITVANMISPEKHQDVVIGPLERLLAENQNLEYRLADIKNQIESLKQNPPYPKRYYDNISAGNTYPPGIAYPTGSFQPGYGAVPPTDMWSTATDPALGITAVTLKDLMDRANKAAVNAQTSAKKDI